MDPNHDRRRGHFHRGRRGPDRRGFDRRSPAPPQAQPPAPPRDQLDVEQIMREIRARIAQRQGVDLSHQQVDDLAARRLEYILDPRAMKPEFLETLRRSADETVEREQKRLPAEPAYVFEDTTLYDSHRTILRAIRKLLNPLLKLFFNPNPLIQALHQQARINVEAAERDAARDRRQAEWNALHYRILERLVTETSRVSLELQALSNRLESLTGRIDFNDRRVRALESTALQPRPAGLTQEAPPPPRPPEPAPAGETASEPAAGAITPPGEGGRRRRRRRRGRRSGSMFPETAPGIPSGARAMEAGAGAHVDAPAAELHEAPLPDEPDTGGTDADDEPPVEARSLSAEPGTATADTPDPGPRPPDPEPRAPDPVSPPAVDRDETDSLD